MGHPVCADLITDLAVVTMWPLGTRIKSVYVKLHLRTYLVGTWTRQTSVFTRSRLKEEKKDYDKTLFSNFSSNSNLDRHHPLSHSLFDKLISIRTKDKIHPFDFDKASMNKL